MSKNVCDGRAVASCWCPGCGKRVDSAIGMMDPASRPSPGDLCVCVYCGVVLVFDANLAVDVASEDALAELSPEQREARRSGSEIHSEQEECTTMKMPDGDELLDDVARCARCGCTEDQPCDGGCAWVPPEVSGVIEDVCSSCVD